MKNRSSLGVILTGGLKEAVTPWAGAAAERALPKKKSSKGLREEQMVESFVLLSALGGDCIDDMKRLREDKGLEAMLGYRPPAPETARQWLDKFHDEKLMADKPIQGAFIPLESAPLAGLKEPNRQVVWTYIDKLRPEWQVTLDVDAHLVETAKVNARYCYEGYRALQPMEVEWAETGLVLADELREGNVPAGRGIKEIVDEAYDMLPPGPWQVRVRSDSAGYQQRVLDHWDSPGWQFAVSADMSPQLKQEIEALPQETWKLWKTEKRGMVREWAEVPFIPARQYEKRNSQPYRYLAIRVRRQQGELFEDGAKAGTIEHIHHILDNELAGGVYPSARHGANAVWLRLQVLTHNLLQLFKAVALPEEYATAHPKRLRFAIFTQFGRVVSHAGIMLLRIANKAWVMLIRSAYYRVLALSPPG